MIEASGEEKKIQRAQRYNHGEGRGVEKKSVRETRRSETTETHKEIINNSTREKDRKIKNTTQSYNERRTTIQKT